MCELYKYFLELYNFLSQERINLCIYYYIKRYFTSNNVFNNTMLINDELSYKYLVL